jgi:hypothetical protein
MQSQGRRGVDVLCAGGEIRLNRQYRWRKGSGGLCPADEVLGIEQSTLSPGALELCSLVGIGGDFDQARQDLKRIGGLTLCKERLRQVVEGQGEQVRQVRDAGQLPAAWSADQAKLADGRSRVYVGVDGVMAPTVTQVEKDKRRQNQITRRQQRGKAGLANTRELPPPKAGSDEKFKEMKIGVFYDQAKEYRHAFATEAQCQSFGPLLASHARQICLEKAIESICLIDGAPWIANQVCVALLFLQAILLDFYHLAEHVHATARCCFGEGQAARTWAGERLTQAKSSDVAGLLSAIGTLEKKCRSPAKRQSLRRLRQYIEERREMLDYAKAREMGWDIGSGPTEATCKTLTLRLKRPGMKWDRDNAASMMNLLALRESGQWEAYWKQMAKPAA